LKKILVYFLNGLSLFGLLIATPALATLPQDGRPANTQTDTLKTKCMVRMEDFLKWYGEFSLSHEKPDDPFFASIVKETVINGKKIYRIDSAGCKSFIDSYYESGYFTRSWKDRALAALLSADKVLANLATDDGEEVANIPVIMGDPVLGIRTFSDWFDPEADKWQIENFKSINGRRFQVDLVCIYLGHDLEDRWRIDLSVEDGKIQISHISGRVQEQMK